MPSIAFASGVTSKTRSVIIFGADIGAIGRFGQRQVMITIIDNSLDYYPVLLDLLEYNPIEIIRLATTIVVPDNLKVEDLLAQCSKLIEMEIPFSIEFPSEITIGYGIKSKAIIGTITSIPKKTIRHIQHIHPRSDKCVENPQDDNNDDTPEEPSGDFEEIEIEINKTG